MIHAETDARNALTLVGLQESLPHPSCADLRTGPKNEHSERPAKRPRPSVLQGYELGMSDDASAGASEQYVLLSGVKRWWKDIQGEVQKTEKGIEARRQHIRELEENLIAHSHALDAREAVVSRQEAALAALMPRLQAVARMESVMSALIPHLKVKGPEGDALMAQKSASQILYEKNLRADSA